MIVLFLMIKQSMSTPYEYGPKFLEDMVVKKFATKNLLKNKDKFKEYKDANKIVGEFLNAGKYVNSPKILFEESYEKEELVLAISILFLSLYYVNKLYTGKLKETTNNLCNKMGFLNGGLIEFYIYKEIYDVIYEKLVDIISDVIYTNVDDYYSYSDFYDYLVLTKSVMGVIYNNEKNYISDNHTGGRINNEVDIEDSLNKLESFMSSLFVSHRVGNIISECYNNKNNNGYNEYGLNKSHHILYKLLDNYCCKK